MDEKEKINNAIRTMKEICNKYYPVCKECPLDSAVCTYDNYPEVWFEIE